MFFESARNNFKFHLVLAVALVLESKDRFLKKRSKLTGGLPFAIIVPSSDKLNTVYLVLKIML